MGRKKKFSSDVMVYACEQHLTVGRPYLSIANELGIHQTTVRKWVYVYREHGSKAFANKGKNNSYSKEFKERVIGEYFKNNSAMYLSGKYNIPSSVIESWIRRYNKGEEITDYNPKPEVYRMKTRRTTKEEKLEIVLYCLDNNKNYKLAAEKYGINYQSVRSWVIRYLEVGHDVFMNSKPGPNSLSTKEMSEVERLEHELKLEKEKNARLERTIETLKKNAKISHELKSKTSTKRKK